MLQFDEYKVRLDRLLPELEDLGHALALDAAERELDLLHAEAAADGFWDDLEKSQQVLQRTKQLQSKIDDQAHRKAAWSDLMTLCQMGNEEDDESLLPELEAGFAALAESLETARLQTLLRGEYDSCNAILNLHAGAGGTEAMDWCLMLFRMYTRWAERRGFTCTVNDLVDGEDYGIKSATLTIAGENAYGYLRSENGVHRLVRVSPFDAQARRHTSFAAVEVIPEIPDSAEVEIRAEDLRIDTYRASGAGGQHVNKTESAVRITHLPTGVITASQSERSQFQNKDTAMRMLRSRLIQLKTQAHLEKISDIKGVQLKIEWGSQIRSYVFMPYQLVKDNRSGYETGNIGTVMDGDLDGFINAYLKAEATGNWAVKS